MSHDDENVIETSDDGRFRVRVETDTECDSPLESGDWWCVSVLHIDGGSHYGGVMAAMHDPEDRLAAWRHFNDSCVSTTPDPDDAFVRYMSIMHGIKVHQVGVGSYGTSGLAWLEPSEAERVGFDPARTEDDPKVIESSLAEYNAWARGECYYYVVEELTTWQRLDRSGQVTDEENGTRDTWETVDSCFGLIGDEYAEQEAREAFAACVAQAEVTR